MVTKAIRDVANVFQCNPVEGFHSFAMDRYKIEGEKSIPNCEEEDEDVVNKPASSRTRSRKNAPGDKVN